MKKTFVISCILLLMGVMHHCYGQNLIEKVNNGLWGFVDESGKWVIKPKCYTAQPFSGNDFDNEYTLVQYETGKANQFGVSPKKAEIIDKKGKQMVEQFDVNHILSSVRYANGMAGGKTFIFDLKTGNYVILPVYAVVPDILENNGSLWKEPYVKYTDYQTKKIGLLRVRDLKVILDPDYRNIDITIPSSVILTKDELCMITDTSWKKPFDFKFQDTCAICSNFKLGNADLSSFNSVSHVMFELIKLVPDNFKNIKGKIILTNGKETHYAVNHINIGASSQEIIEDDNNHPSYFATFLSTGVSDLSNHTMIANLASIFINKFDSINLEIKTTHDDNNNQLRKVFYKKDLVALYSIQPGQSMLLIGKYPAFTAEMKSKMLVSASAMEQKKNEVPVIKNNFIDNYHKTEEEIRARYPQVAFGEGRFGANKELFFANDQGTYSFIIKKNICIALYFQTNNMDDFNDTRLYFDKIYSKINLYTWSYATKDGIISIEKAAYILTKDVHDTDKPIFQFGKEYDNFGAK